MPDTNLARLAESMARMEERQDVSEAWRVESRKMWHEMNNTTQSLIGEIRGLGLQEFKAAVDNRLVSIEKGIAEQQGANKMIKRVLAGLGTIASLAAGWIATQLWPHIGWK